MLTGGRIRADISMVKKLSLLSESGYLCSIRMDFCKPDSDEWDSQRNLPHVNITLVGQPEPKPIKGCSGTVMDRSKPGHHSHVQIAISFSNASSKTIFCIFFYL